MDAVGDRSLRDLLDEQTALYGDRTFLVHETLDGEVSDYSFKQVRDASQRYAAVLQQLGVRKGDRVFVFLRNTPDYVPVWFGISLAGAVLVPGNIYLTDREVTYQVGHSAPSLVITEEHYLGLISQVCRHLPQAPRVVLNRVKGGQAEGEPDVPVLESLLAGAPDYQPPPISSTELAQILYTSGTTARPKGVMLTHANMLWCGLSSALHSGFQPEDRLFNNKPLFHANCQDTVLSALTAGSTVILGERYSASRYMQQLVRHGATVCSLSGMLCRTLLNQPPSEYDRAHNIRFAAYAINISEEEVRRFHERFGIRLRNGYGQSEAMLYITFDAVASPSAYPSIGRAIMGREVMVVNESNEVLPPGQVGEIVVRGVPGRNLMLGYYCDDEATRKAFDGGWLHTGDMGYLDARGNVYFFGRLKEVIKRAGENVSAAEVEEVIIGHEAVQDVAVIGIPDPIRDQAVVACVVLRKGFRVSAEELRAHCEAHLAYFKVPQIVTFMDHLPRNASGKVQKKQLVENHVDT